MTADPDKKVNAQPDPATPPPAAGHSAWDTVKRNARDYMMYIALVVIILYFTIRTNGLFMQARNISDLFNQAAYVAVLAIGMTLILILKHIDLSVGFVAGFTGAIASILLMKGVHVVPTILICLLLGVAIGFYQGFLVTRVGVPAFVTTLAGMFIFRGLLALSLQKTGTIIISDPFFNALCNDFIPDFREGGFPITIGGTVQNVHLVTMILGILMIVLLIINSIRQRKHNLAYDFKVSSMAVFVVKLVIMAVVIFLMFWLLATYKGIPWSAVIVTVFLLIYHHMLSHTRLGRHIYAIGGNEQAAELSGINVKNVTHFVFISMSFMAALAGILFTSRMRSATPQAGIGFELDAIASAYIGGVAVSGGIGKVTNTIIGTLVIISLTNGMNLLGVDNSIQYIVKGLIFVVAVAFDVRTRRRAR
ncbi:MAG: sugar ABC transporter permease [Saccharofermentanales bacterium]|jgi:putative multiple sugar transport system permease protein